MSNQDVSAFDEILATTRSVRRKIDFERPVDPSLILQCVEIAVQAPTGVGDETWRFVVLTDEQKKRDMADLYRRAFDEFLGSRSEELREEGVRLEDLSPNYRFLADRMQDFPSLVLVCRHGRPPEEFARQIAFYGSVLPAAWSFMVALRARGLGSTWTTLHALYESETADLLGIPADVTAAILLPVGHMKGAVLRRADRQPAEQVTYWNHWGAMDAIDS